jgi:hypothetical protein
MTSKMALGLTVLLSLIWLFKLVSLYIWNLSIVSIKLPFLVACGMVKISLMGPMEWLLSSRGVAKLDFRILYLSRGNVLYILFFPRNM